ncbi:MAG: GrpB family protein [Verrucomicrobia bacterium]|nr:GrpB family protein [Verrucomicrobiota bacterium]
MLIEVVPYDPKWPQLFASEALLIQQALGPNCISIHHIGSTAVPGLAAKPVIDIMPVVSSIEEVNEAGMIAVGYEAKGEFGMPFRRYFQKGNPRTHHVHIFEQDNPEIERHLKFRNWMRTHEEDRNAYAKIKSDLAHQHPNDREAYCLAKEPFVSAMEAKIGSDALRLVGACTEREWKAMHRLQQEPPSNNAHPFILYDGVEIAAVAIIEFLNETEATMKSLVINESINKKDYKSYLLKTLDKWTRHHNRTLCSFDAL